MISIKENSNPITTDAILKRARKKTGAYDDVVLYTNVQDLDKKKHSSKKFVPYSIVYTLTQNGKLSPRISETSPLKSRVYEPDKNVHESILKCLEKAYYKYRSTPINNTDREDVYIKGPHTVLPIYHDYRDVVLTTYGHKEPMLLVVIKDPHRINKKFQNKTCHNVLRHESTILDLVFLAKYSINYELITVSAGTVVYISNRVAFYTTNRDAACEERLFMETRTSIIQPLYWCTCYDKMVGSLAFCAGCCYMIKQDEIQVHFMNHSVCKVCGVYVPDKLAEHLMTEHQVESYKPKYNRKRKFKEDVSSAESETEEIQQPNISTPLQDEIDDDDITFLDEIPVTRTILTTTEKIVEESEQIGPLAAVMDPPNDDEMEVMCEFSTNSPEPPELPLPLPPSPKRVKVEPDEPYPPLPPPAAEPTPPPPPEPSSPPPTPPPPPVVEPPPSVVEPPPPVAEPTPPVAEPTPPTPPPPPEPTPPTPPEPTPPTPPQTERPPLKKVKPNKIAAKSLPKPKQLNNQNSEKPSKKKLKKEITPIKKNTSKSGFRYNYVIPKKSSSKIKIEEKNEVIKSEKPKSCKKEEEKKLEEKLRPCHPPKVKIPKKNLTEDIKKLELEIEATKKECEQLTNRLYGNSNDDETLQAINSISDYDPVNSFDTINSYNCDKVFLDVHEQLNNLSQ